MPITNNDINDLRVTNDIWTYPEYEWVYEKIFENSACYQFNNKLYAKVIVTLKRLIMRNIIKFCYVLYMLCLLLYYLNSKVSFYRTFHD